MVHVHFVTEGEGVREETHWAARQTAQKVSIRYFFNCDSGVTYMGSLDRQGDIIGRFLPSARISGSDQFTIQSDIRPDGNHRVIIRLLTSAAAGAERATRGQTYSRAPLCTTPALSCRGVRNLAIRIKSIRKTLLSINPGVTWSPVGAQVSMGGCESLSGELLDMTASSLISYQ